MMGQPGMPVMGDAMAVVLVIVVFVISFIQAFKKDRN